MASTALSAGTSTAPDCWSDGLVCANDGDRVASLAALAEDVDGGHGWLAHAAMYASRCRRVWRRYRVRGRLNRVHADHPGEGRHA